MALGPVRGPARGQARLVLREHHVRVAQAAVVGHGADAGQGAAQVLLQQAERAADAGPAGRCGSGPRHPKPALSRIRAPMGPLTITTGNALPDAACNVSLPDSGSRKASTAATSTGRYSGPPPPIPRPTPHPSTLLTPPP